MKPNTEIDRLAEKLGENTVAPHHRPFMRQEEVEKMDKERQKILYRIKNLLSKK